jgi:hypothetical protein
MLKKIKNGVIAASLFSLPVFADTGTELSTMYSSMGIDFSDLIQQAVVVIGGILATVVAVRLVISLVRACINHARSAFGR